MYTNSHEANFTATSILFHCHYVIYLSKKKYLSVKRSAITDCSWITVKPVLMQENRKKKYFPSSYTMFLCSVRT